MWYSNLSHFTIDSIVISGFKLLGVKNKLRRISKFDVITSRKYLGSLLIVFVYCVWLYSSRLPSEPISQLLR